MVERAKVVLEALERGEREGGTRKHTLIDDLPLFSAAPVAPPKPAAAKTTEIEEALSAIHPDEMTPIEALNALYALKAKLKG